MNESKAQYRYPGVLPFQENQQHLFFGRDEEIDRLYGLISSEKLLVLYGRSGYGKSSLIKAGLFPRLEHENTRKKRYYLPVYVRFNIRHTPQDDLFDKYYFHLEQALNEVSIAAHTVQVAALPNTMWATMKRWKLPKNTTIVLVFDQFEEFFSYPIEQQEVFETQLAELLYTAYPLWLEKNEDSLSLAEEEHLVQPMDVRALFAIRSDRMSELDQLRNRLPAILHKRIELKAFTPEQAKAAIIGPALRGSPLYEQWRAQRPADHTTAAQFVSPAFEYTEDALNRIVSELSQRAVNEVASIEAFLLQLLCRSIEEKAIAGELKDVNGTGVPDVTPADVPDVQEVFSLYYFSSFKRLPPDKRRIAQRVIEERLVRIDPRTQEGRRVSVDRDTLLDEYSPYGLDTDLLLDLEGIFLLRKERNSVGTHNYEISHDTLVPSIVQARREREVKEERERLAEEARREKAEYAKREAEREAQFRLEQRKRRRQRWWLIYSVLIAIVACLTAFWAIDARNTAKTAESKALKQERLAKTANTKNEELLTQVQAQNESLARQRNQLQRALTQVVKSDSIATVRANEAEVSLGRMRAAERARLQGEVNKFLSAAERMLEINDTTMAIQILRGALELAPGDQRIRKQLKQLER